MTILPVTDELLADSVVNPIKLIQTMMRRALLFQTADLEGRVEYRGGGWWHLDSQTIRGKRRVMDALEKEAA